MNLLYKKNTKANRIVQTFQSTIQSIRNAIIQNEGEFLYLAAYSLIYSYEFLHTTMFGYTHPDVDRVVKVVALMLIGVTVLSIASFRFKKSVN